MFFVNLVQLTKNINPHLAFKDSIVGCSFISLIQYKYNIIITKL